MMVFNQQKTIINQKPEWSIPCKSQTPSGPLHLFCRAVCFDDNFAVGQDEYDLVDINGKPPVRVKTNTVLWGDKSTGALLLNYISIMLKAKPCSHTVNNLRFPGYNSEN